MQPSIHHQVSSLWSDMDAQRWDALAGYFNPDAQILWPNTNERFTVEEYVKANAHYPGRWHIRLKRVEINGHLAISVAQVQGLTDAFSLHVVSFFTYEQGRIQQLVEYWAEDGPPPSWRKEMGLGQPMNP